jgi:quinohemoprotein ethanol dehydrogenase
MLHHATIPPNNKFQEKGSNTMTRILPRAGLLAVLAITLQACDKQSTGEPQQPETPVPAVETVPSASAPAQVTSQRLIEADNEPGNWMSYGRTYSEQRYSPLKQVNTDNVADLGLTWSYDLKTERGIEATSIVVDGVMYTTSAWSIVHAIDARNGEHI